MNWCCSRLRALSCLQTNTHTYTHLHTYMYVSVSIAISPLVSKFNAKVQCTQTSCNTLATVATRSYADISPKFICAKACEFVQIV